MKKRIHAKIGTLPMTVIVLWRDDYEIKEGSTIFAMEAQLYDSLHWDFRRRKSCQYWKPYHVTHVNQTLPFLSR